MTSPSVLALCCTVVLALSQHCMAKPHHSKKSHFQPMKGAEDNPFAPPAFYDDTNEYEMRDSKWMSWTPSSKHEVKTEKVPVEDEQKVEPKDQPTEKPEKVEEDDNKLILPVAPQKEEVVKKDLKPIEPKFGDQCKNVYCKYGRVCETSKDGIPQCVCAGPEYCQGHHKQVCGTDGVLYPSHCELHRKACVKGMHIGIDHQGSVCGHIPDKTDNLISEPLSIEVTQEKVKDTDNEVKELPDELPDDKKSVEEATSLEDNAVEDEVKVKDELKDVEDNKDTDKVKDDNKMKPADPLDEDYGYKTVTELKTPCEEIEYERLKNNLLQYHCARIGEMDCTTDPAKKQFVANIMFNYYDLDHNEKLDETDLNEIERRDHLDKLSRFCRLADFLTFNDREGDGSIMLNEFYSAFKIPTVALDDKLKVFTSMVATGNSVELKCDIKGAVEVVWQRNGASLDELISDDIQIFEDGSLYLKNIGLHHIGNYSCKDKYDDSVKQTHILKVQMLPQVRVSPSTQFHTSGASVTLKCHADGVPQPEVTWEMNEAPLPEDIASKHYLMQNNNSTLQIKQATYTKDTGAYKCKARNSAGVAQDIATVFIENSNVPKYSDASIREVFLVFHDKGYTVYEPNHCHIEHQVLASFSNIKYRPEYDNVLRTLCEEEGCVWGDAVNVRNQYIYITQPTLHRVVVIEITERNNPVEIISTDKYPVKLHYVEHLDQVWMLCWNQAEDTGSKTAIIVRQASEGIQHHTVHTQPIGNRFDLIEEFFLPPSNDLHHKFNYGYVMHQDQQGLYKLDLEAMQYVKNIDLRKYSCVPKSVAFIPMGGKVIVHCVAPQGEKEQSSRVVLDYVTDQVLEHTPLGGVPYLSPDARYLVTVEIDGNTISVSRLNDDGSMEHVFDEYTNLRLSDVTFFPSQRGRGYDFFASASNKNSVLYINLETGKVEMIEGVGDSEQDDQYPWTKHTRTIASGGIFGNFLMTPSKDSVVVIDGIQRLVQCEWQNIKHGNVIVWVDPMHL